MLDAQGQMGSGVEGHGSLFCVSVALVNSCLPVCVCVECVVCICVVCGLCGFCVCRVCMCVHILSSTSNSLLRRWPHISCLCSLLSLRMLHRYLWSVFPQTSFVYTTGNHIRAPMWPTCPLALFCSQIHKITEETCG